MSLIIENRGRYIEISGVSVFFINKKPLAGMTDAGGE
jgi:hypothetical protein